MLLFWLGFSLGAGVGLFACALCVMASDRYDDRLN